MTALGSAYSLARSVTYRPLTVERQRMRDNRDVTPERSRGRDGEADDGPSQEPKPSARADTDSAQPADKSSEADLSARPWDRRIGLRIQCRSRNSNPCLPVEPRTLLFSSGGSARSSVDRICNPMLLRTEALHNMHFENQNLAVCQVCGVFGREVGSRKLLMQIDCKGHRGQHRKALEPEHPGKISYSVQKPHLRVSGALRGR
jgi:hypothetical protein